MAYRTREPEITIPLRLPAVETRTSAVIQNSPAGPNTRLADAEATEVYARAYNQSADSRRFYEFLKSMETLEKTVDEETRFLLSTDGDFYRFLEGSGR